MNSQSRNKPARLLLFLLFLRGALGAEKKSNPQVGFNASVNHTVADGALTLSSVLDRRDSTEDPFHNGGNRNSTPRFHPALTEASFPTSSSDLENSDGEDSVTVVIRGEASVGEKNLPWNATTVPFSFDTRREEEGGTTPSDEFTTAHWDNSVFPLNLPQQFCVAGKVVERWCYCDAFCLLFQDCCFTASECKERSPSSAVRLNRRNIECLLQSAKLIKGIQAQHFWMVTSCPDEWLHDTVRTKCEAPRNGSEVDLLVPVSDSVTKLTFRNKHCAACHGMSGVQVQPWDFYITCSSGTPYGIDKFFNIADPNDAVDQARSSKGCTLFFQPPTSIPGRPCIPSQQMPMILTSNGRISTGQCSRNADPKHKELCSSGPMSITYVQTWASSYYGRNIFCWVCRLPKGYVPAVSECSNQETSRSFDPQGYSVLLDMSGVQYSKPCEQSEKQVLCNEEEGQCSTPIQHLFNAAFSLQIGLISRDRLNATVAEGICRAKGLEEFDSLPFVGAWRKHGPKMCAEVSPNATIPSLAAVVVYKVVLMKKIRGYREGVQMFASFQREKAEELQTRNASFTYNGNEYRATVLDADMPQCPMNTANRKPPTAMPAGASGRLQGSSLAFTILWGAFACQILIMVNAKC